MTSIDEEVALFRDEIDKTLIVKRGAPEKDAELIVIAAKLQGYQIEAVMRSWAKQQPDDRYVELIFAGAIRMYVDQVLGEPASGDPQVLATMFATFRDISSTAGGGDECSTPAH